MARHEALPIFRKDLTMTNNSFSNQTALKSALNTFLNASDKAACTFTDKVLVYIQNFKELNGKEANPLRDKEERVFLKKIWSEKSSNRFEKGLLYKILLTAEKNADIFDKIENYKAIMKRNKMTLSCSKAIGDKPAEKATKSYKSDKSDKSATTSDLKGLLSFIESASLDDCNSLWIALEKRMEKI